MERVGYTERRGRQTMIDFSQMIIEKPNVKSILANSMESGLGLDISKTSTGITVFDGVGYKTYQCVIDFDSESPLWMYYMQKALEDDLLSLIDGEHYDIIAIEDAIDGENFHTVRVLILLNTVIDKLIAEGRVTCNNFIRISNTVWKKHLRKFRLGKKYMTDKIEIETILGSLEHDVVIDYGHLKKSEKERMGYQDQLDSTGVLIGAGLHRDSKVETYKKQRQLYTRTILLYESSELLEENWTIDNLKQVRLKGNIKTEVDKFINELKRNGDLNKYVAKVESFGMLGIELGQRDADNGENYIVMYVEKG